MKIEVLRELLVCDRVKSALSENCLKYVLSTESVSENGNGVDRFIALMLHMPKRAEYLTSSFHSFHKLDLT